jgi:uncharacterized protein YjbJ (UPF0337 family)
MARGVRSTVVGTDGATAESPEQSWSIPTMSDTSKDRIEGTVDEAKGRVKSAAGELTGDRDLQAEGEADQMSGKIKQGIADAKDKVDHLVRKVTDR